jgi:RimJ/RimL family protein N-acetyltransferase
LAADDPIIAMPSVAITERMLLRPFTEVDLGWLTALHGDPAVMRYIDSPVPADFVAAVTLPAFLREHAELPAGVGHFAALREPGGEPLGWFGLAPPSSLALQHAATIGLDRVVSDALEVGYRLFPSAWGQGYATEGTRTLVRRAFTEGGAAHVVATTMSVNVASRRVLEKAGLTLAGTLLIDWPDPLDGAEHGEVIYAANRQDWLRST